MLLVQKQTGRPMGQLISKKGAKTHDGGKKATSISAAKKTG
jgi:hypothetical protein